MLDYDCAKKGTRIWEDFVMKPSGLVIESGLTKLTQLSRTRDLLLAGKLGMFILFL